MAMLVVADRVSVVGGVDVILDDVSFGVATGDRVGVVGRNGVGKSTLLRVLRGDQRLQSGRTAWVGGSGGRSVLMLEQADALDPAESVRAVVLGTMDEHEWASDARVRDVLAGLLGGLDAAGVGGLATPVGSLSGGQRRRVALAAALVADPDLLLLDEPTNHLDLEAIAWLAQHLTGRRAGSATVTVTHDRWFLDATSTSTWEVVDGQVRPFEGGYAAYVLAKAERERVEAVTAARRDNLLRKELAWLRRGAPARTSKPRFRLEEAAALIADEPPPRDSVALARFATSRLGKDVLELIDAEVGFDSRPVLTGVTWRLAPGERVGIVGPNGAGKSTVVRALLGQVELSAGRRTAGRTVVAAYLSQELVELVPLADRQVIEAVTDVRSVTRLGDKEVTAGQLATRLGFVGARQQTRVGDLSGGERRRLQLLRLLMTEPNVLVLDEPTNDLDIEMLTALEDLLDGWPGTLVVISHDRYLIERVTDHQVGLFGDGQVRDLPGGVEEYLARRAEQAARRSAPASGGSTSGSSGPVGGSPEPSRAEQARQARKDLGRIERRLAALEAQEAGVHAEMAEHAVDHQRVARLHRQAQELAAERAALEEQWLEVAELLP